MRALIQKSDLDAYKYVAESVKNETTWEQFVQEAQLLDVKCWLSDALLLELIDQYPNSLTAANQLLLDGGEYEYCDITRHFEGLKACIIYYAFARFTNRQPYNYTAAGVVMKDSDFSTPATDKHIQRLETEARLTADALKDEVILFLTRNHEDYPLWEESGCYYRANCGRSRPFQVLGE